MTENLPILRETLEDMEHNRNKAILLYEKAFDMLAEARKYESLASCSKNITSFNKDIKDFIIPMDYNNIYRFGKDINPRDLFMQEITKQIDKAMWIYVIQSTDLERVMDHQARNELRMSFEKDLIPATADNIRTTLAGFLENSQTIFQRGIVNAFSGLDRRFRSHDGFKIGNRIILKNAFQTTYNIWDYSSRKDEILRDIERTFYILDGKENPKNSYGIFGKISEQKTLSWCVEGDYFRVRRFNNGNAHLWFTRDDLVKKINRMLADYYGEVIGESPDVADISDMGPSYHVTPAKNFGLFESHHAVVDAIFDKIKFNILGKTVLEPSAGRGNLAQEAARLGGIVKCVE